jgi:hypothetical protein
MNFWCFDSGVCRFTRKLGVPLSLLQRPPVGIQNGSETGAYIHWNLSVLRVYHALMFGSLRLSCTCHFHFHQVIARILFEMHEFIAPLPRLTSCSLSGRKGGR